MITKKVLDALPDCVVASTVTQAEDEEHWLGERKKHIGGSDIGAILGVSPFTSARQIYFNKTNQFQDVLKPGEASVERMRWGRLLEPVVADEFASRTGKKLIEAGATFTSKQYPFMAANVDRLIVDDEGIPYGILEVKTTSAYNADEWESGDILLSYVYQLQFYMYVTGLKYGAFACLAGGNKFFHYEVARNDELIQNTLIPAAKSFWFDNVLALREPELQSADTDYANTTYATVEKNSELVLDGDIENELARTVVECKKQIKELEATLEEAQNRLKDRLQEHEIGYCRDFTVKWSPRSRTAVDSAVLKKDFPEIYEKCKKTTSYRVMSVKGLDI